MRRATPRRSASARWIGPAARWRSSEGTERDIECDLIVSAIGQAPDFKGLELIDNGKGAAAADAYHRSPKRPGVFVGGDVIKPHLLTTAIGHAWIASESIDHYLRGRDQHKSAEGERASFRPAREAQGSWAANLPSTITSKQAAPIRAKYAVHNFEDRARSQVVPPTSCSWGISRERRNTARARTPSTPATCSGNFETRLQTLSRSEARAEADRCMSCGMCFECDNCMIYCPQDAVHRVKKRKRRLGRYVDTDYAKCIGCHICKDVCPTGYIQMGLGGVAHMLAGDQHRFFVVPESASALDRDRKNGPDFLSPG